MTSTSCFKIENLFSFSKLNVIAYKEHCLKLGSGVQPEANMGSNPYNSSGSLASFVRVGFTRHDQNCN